MAATRRQNQSQKLQEKLISQALSEDKPKSSHLSFDDGDEDEATQSAHIGLDTSDRQRDTDRVSVAGEEDREDDDTIEVVSTKSSRKKASEEAIKLKAQEKEARAKRQEADRKRAEKKKKEKEEAEAISRAKTKVQSLEAASRSGNMGVSDQKGEEAGAPLDDDTHANSEEENQGPPAGSSRLDPSLFAQVFAKPVSAPKSILKRRTAEEQADEVAQAQAERRKRRKEQRRGGLVKGRDGMLMKTAADGTIIRSLNSSSQPATSQKKTEFDEEGEEEEGLPLDPVVRPTLIDPTISLPNAKARAFKKRNLERKGSGRPASVQSKATQAATKDEDDPLGLNDPAFLPGGDFYHLVNKNKRPKQTGAGVPGQVARQGYRGGGTRKDAVSVLRSRSRTGPSLGFARSQM